MDIRSVSAITAHHNGISVLSDEAAHVLGVAKELLHNAEFPDRYAAGAAEAFRAKPDQIERVFKPMGPKANSILRALCLGARGHSSLKRSCGELRRAVLMHAFRKAPLGFVLRRLTYEMSKVRRFLRPSGLVLAVLGADGAGKSTVIDAIAPVLDQATHGAFYRRHLRPGFLPPLGRLRGARTNSGPVTDPHGSTPAGWIGSAVRFVWLWLDYVIGYWVVVRPKIAKSPAVFLFDRYAHDALLDPRRLRLGLPRRVLNLFLNLVPSPDLIICLHGDPEVVAARKNELPVEEVRRQTNALRELASKTPNAVLVSTDGSVEEATDAVLYALRTFLLERDRKAK
jgi:thymidylate kinase